MPHATTDIRTSLLLLSYYPGACYEPNNNGLYPIHLLARTSPPIELVEGVLKVCPYSIGFFTENEANLLPLDLAFRFNASAGA
jgi:hypothetical protein